MIKVGVSDVWGFEHAIRGMRNPMNSWGKSDSRYGCEDGVCDNCYYSNKCKCCYRYYIPGKNDMELMRKLYKAGTEHRKFLRQIFVSMDILAPLYWWKEFDTYKVGTVANSCSTMHKIHAFEFRLDDFSHDGLTNESLEVLKAVVACLNVCRKKYIETKDKTWWWQMIQLLPSSYNQLRTVTMNYENVVSMIHQRENHKLDEWREFVKCLRDLPYLERIIEVEQK